MFLKCSPERGTVTSRRLTRLEDADIEAAAAVWQAAWTAGHGGHVPDDLMAVRNADHFSTYLREHRADTTVCVGLAGDIVGLVITDLGAGEVVQLAVAAQARGTGTADVLLEAAEARLAGRHEQAWLAVVPGNERARAFYARHRWRDAGAQVYRAPAGRSEIAVPVRRYLKDLLVSHRIRSGGPRLLVPDHPVRDTRRVEKPDEVLQNR